MSKEQKRFIWAFWGKDIADPLQKRFRTHCSWDGPLSDAYKKYILFSEHEAEIETLREENTKLRSAITGGLMDLVEKDTITLIIDQANALAEALEHALNPIDMGLGLLPSSPETKIMISALADFKKFKEQK